MAVVLAVKLLEGPALYKAAIFGDSTGLLQNTKMLDDRYPGMFCYSLQA